ncbi:carbon-nitrogen family hydrolase [Clostridium sp. Maddingley MBC34-26]|uniref:carbon-nitrogen family hydrolase n=1 Tax=Clostridium sp. Maddingley MBC34-26 TaxID=1196322 RepID=UPI0002975053|nr:carbon-nitrogen family hydrolase [Clostridium sp. Maddingley MBC34-26]EKQ50364.1 MAG: putative amidohydrolase [Clostridium sp. Maddingley MBC34-26]
MIIGIAQINIVWENARENMKKVEEFAQKASKSNVELVLFPEMTFTGFTMNIQKLLLSENEIVNWIKKVAVNNNVNIGLGFAVKVDEKGENKYVVISKEGNILAQYIKIHPFSYGGEDKKYYCGKKICTFTIGEFKITPFICYDLRFPEIFQAASKAAQIITVAASWPEDREEHWVTLLKARAIENQCYIIGINRVGEGDNLHYGGASIFVNPNGEILNEISSKETLIVSNIEMNDITKIKNKFDIKKDRQEKLYITLNK